jgi:hypothetical protein
MLKGKTMEEKNINNAQQTASLSASRSHTGGRKVVVKTGTTFNFTKANIKNLKYQGKKERPDKLDLNEIKQNLSEYEQRKRK